MATVYVNSGLEMANLNRNMWKKVENIQLRTIQKMAEVNVVESKRVVKPFNFTGNLFSQIELKNPGSFRTVQVWSSAPYSYNIEKGIAPALQGNPYGRGWMSFSESPQLEDWVRRKLMVKEPELAKFFLNRQAVRLGLHGFPYGTNGLHFMQFGFDRAVLVGTRYLSDEITKLRV